MTTSPLCHPSTIQLPLGALKGTDGEAKWSVDIRGSYGAIAIGPNSDIDRCVILAEGKGAPIGRVVTAGRVERDRVSQHVIPISVERPYVGCLDGPFTVLGPYSPYIHAAAPGFGQRVIPTTAVSTLNLWGDDSLGIRPHRTAMLELQFFPYQPAWLPQYRPPLEHAVRHAFSSGSGGYGFHLPTFGRRRLELHHEYVVSGMSGSLTWRALGVHFLEAPSSLGPGSRIETELQPSTPITANEEDSFQLQGEFDYIRLIYTNSLIAGSVNLHSIIKAWDR